MTGLTPGAHTVAYKDVTGWQKPAPQQINITSSQTTAITATYTAVTTSPGSLKVTLAPTQAVSAGAQWQVDAGNWQSSGATVSGLTPGAHTVAYKDVTGWQKPAPQQINITSNQTTAITATYTAITANGSMVVFGYNELGMHCMNDDFSEFMILPPYNTLRALVIDRSGEEPHIVQSGIQINYTIPGNTT